MVTFYSVPHLIRTLIEILSMNLVIKFFKTQDNFLKKKKTSKFTNINFFVIFLFSFLVLLCFRLEWTLCISHFPVIGGWGNEVSLLNHFIIWTCLRMDVTLFVHNVIHLYNMYIIYMYERVFEWVSECVCGCLLA